MYLLKFELGEKEVFNHKFKNNELFFYFSSLVKILKNCSVKWIYVKNFVWLTKCRIQCMSFSLTKNPLY